MSLKEHPWLVTRTLQGDGTTIVYDKDAENRSTAVGKAYFINANGNAELVGDGDKIDGKVIAVTDDNMITGSHMFGGLTFPLGDSVTVARGNSLVGALGASNAKGHVKPAPSATAHTDIAAGDVNTDAKIATEINTVGANVDSVIDPADGRGTVLEFDSTHALVAFP